MNTQAAETGVRFLGNKTKVVRWQFLNMNTQVAETGVRFLGNETKVVRWQFLNMNTQVVEPWAYLGIAQLVRRWAFFHFFSIYIER